MRRWISLAGGLLLCAAPRAMLGQAPFTLGADISFLDSPPTRGRAARSYQEGGKAADELSLLMRHGWTSFRLRVFVSPVREAPDNSLANTIPLARRIKAAGATLLLDIHYSDTWADPQHQEIPVAWRGLPFDSLEARVESYSREVIRTLKDSGAMPDWVQVGNEITRGTLWPLGQLHVPGAAQYNPPDGSDSTVQWDHLTRILKAGIRGVRAGAGNTPPRIAIHIDRGGDWAHHGEWVASITWRRRTSTTTSSRRASYPLLCGATGRSTTSGRTWSSAPGATTRTFWAAETELHEKSLTRLTTQT